MEKKFIFILVVFILTSISWAEIGNNSKDMNKKSAEEFYSALGCFICQLMQFFIYITALILTIIILISPILLLIIIVILVIYKKSTNNNKKKYAKILLILFGIIIALFILLIILIFISPYLISLIFGIQMPNSIDLILNGCMDLCIYPD